MRSHERRTFRYEVIDGDDLSATDLRQIYASAIDDGAFSTVTALLIHIDGEANPAQALLIDWDEDDDDTHLDYRTHRMGIAWGADATWGDVVFGSANIIVPTIDRWLNDPEAWLASN